MLGSVASALKELSQPETYLAKQVHCTPIIARLCIPPSWMTPSDVFRTVLADMSFNTSSSIVISSGVKITVRIDRCSSVSLGGKATSKSMMRSPRSPAFPTTGNPKPGSSRRKPDRVICANRGSNRKMNAKDVSVVKNYRVSRAGREKDIHGMHGRSRGTIDPRIPTTPGRSTLGFHRPGRYFAPKARSTVRSQRQAGLGGERTHLLLDLVT